MDASAFVAKWRHVTLTERSAAQQHFLDLCELVGHKKPAELDPEGEFFTFERGVTKRTGKRGWADVWKRDHFAFEYKGRHKDLDAFLPLIGPRQLRGIEVNPYAHDLAQLGLLQSHLHEVWTLANCGWHGIGIAATYDPTTCFESFPFPEPNESQKAAIAEAARHLDELRSRWLNPPEWTRTEVLEFLGSADGPWARYVHDPDERGIGTVRYPRTRPRNADAAKLLAKRTLTHLYNERPTWLDLAHRALDEAVFAAYGWPPDLSDDDLLARLLALNLERAPAGSTPASPARARRRGALNPESRTRSRLNPGGESSDG